jgi:hypothetical protein
MKGEKKERGERGIKKVKPIKMRETGEDPSTLFDSIQQIYLCTNPIYLPLSISMS